MNLKQTQQDLSSAYIQSERATLEEIHATLVSTRAKLDRWFDKYIDMFDDKMNSVPTSHPVWKLYNSKFDEYSLLNKTIKTAEHYMETT